MFGNTDILGECTLERANTKWNFYKLTIVTVFTALLCKVPFGCKDAVLPELLTKSHSVKCLTCKENTKKTYADSLCLFEAFVLPFHGYGGLEKETSKMFNFFSGKNGGSDPASF